MPPIARLVLLTAAAVVVAPRLAGAQQAPVPAPTCEGVPTAVAEMERLDAMRSGLAAGFLQTGAPADREAFGKVCKPVGQSMQQTAKANGWTARQVAIKFRNPANEADPEAARVLTQMQRDTSLHAVTLRTTMNGAAGTRYLRRITVEPACLMCHGPKAGRPEFVKQNYPKDRAFDFSVGDLRGAYSVFIPAAK